MHLRRYSWRWWLLSVGLLLLIVGAVGTLIAGKLWLVLLLIGAVFVILGLPVWNGLRETKGR